MAAEARRCVLTSFVAVFMAMEEKLGLLIAAGCVSSPSPHAGWFSQRMDRHLDGSRNF